MNNVDNARNIMIKVPRKFIFIYFMLAIILANNNSWVFDNFSGIAFWVLYILGMSMLIYAFRLLYKFYSRKSLKRMEVDACENILFVHQKLRNSPTYTFDHNARKRNIKIAVKGNVMNFLENGESVARIYRHTLKEKADWEWLIDYFGN